MGMPVICSYCCLGQSVGCKHCNSVVFVKHCSVLCVANLLWVWCRRLTDVSKISIVGTTQACRWSSTYKKLRVTIQGRIIVNILNDSSDPCGVFITVLSSLVLSV